MEDFLDILWILVVAGSVIASVISKGNKEKGKKSSLPEAFPTTTTDTLWTEYEAGNTSEEASATHKDPATITPAAWPDKTRQASSAPPSRPFWEFTQPVGADSPGTVAESTFTTPDEVLEIMSPEPMTETEAFAAGTEKSLPTPAETTISGPEKESPETDLLTDFDLQKAVVWSEVLKPKFEEI